MDEQLLPKDQIRQKAASNTSVSNNNLMNNETREESFRRGTQASNIRMTDNSMCDASMAVHAMVSTDNLEFSQSRPAESSNADLQETYAHFAMPFEKAPPEDPPKRFKRLTIPNAHVVPNQQEIQKGHERTESTRNINEAIRQKTLELDEQKNEREPLLLKTAQSNIDTSAQSTVLPTADGLMSSTESNSTGPERLTAAVNRFGKPIAFDFSTSQELGGTGCCKK